jgi:hypothetical protein
MCSMWFRRRAAIMALLAHIHMHFRHLMLNVGRCRACVCAADCDAIVHWARMDRAGLGYQQGKPESEQSREGPPHLRVMAHDLSLTSLQVDGIPQMTHVGSIAESAAVRWRHDTVIGVERGTVTADAVTHSERVFVY